MRLRLKSFASILGLIVLMIILAGIYLYNKPHKNYIKAKPELSISAEELFLAFQSDETSANDLFLGKVIEVSGELVDISQNHNESISIYMFDKMFGVTCTFDYEYTQENQAAINIIKPGQMVTIKGRCDGFLTDVRLSKCSIQPK